MNYSQDSWIPLHILVLIILGLSVVSAKAECPAIDFENLAAGTIVTNQYSGVTFSAPATNPDCTGTALIVSGAGIGGTSSGTRAIASQAGGGCDFAPQYLRMVFSVAHDEVIFNMGPGCGTYHVRAYSTTSGGTAISTQNITITDCTVWHGVYRYVRVYSAAANIRRIEIDAGEAVAEAIDDLQFSVDTTPPTAYIDTPNFDACACGVVQLRGVVCDSDGEYQRDWAEYLKADAPAGTAWTLIDEATTPVCTAGLLYYWDTSALTSGRYFVRVTAENECGLSTSDVTVVYVDRVFDTLTLKYPSTGAVIAGNVCIDGTAWDWICFDEYTVRYRPSGGGAWNPVDPIIPKYESTVINDPLAWWATNEVADGSYQISIDAIDTCGNAGNILRSVVIDNTAPVAMLDDSLRCMMVEGDVEISGTASDANIARWDLYYARGTTNVWEPIAFGTTSVVNGLLGTLNTAELGQCAYAIRLVVTDKAAIGCQTMLTHQSDDVIVVNTGGLCDANGDGEINGMDVQPFVECLLSD